jgi:hypothetical protein
MKKKKTKSRSKKNFKNKMITLKNNSKNKFNNHVITKK